MAASAAILKIFSVKEWPDLENMVRLHSRSLEMTPFDRLTPSEFREDLDIHKTRMNGLSCGEENISIGSAVLIQYQCVTDRRTDGRPAYIYYVLQHS